MALYALTVLLAAFLLFQVQPVVAKMILPWFGGAGAVWSTCMLFFQAALLAGYLYAHRLNEKLDGRRQALVHSGLLAASLLVLPLTPDAAWQGTGLENPQWRILGLLAATVGLPYFLLATTSPLVQAWYARRQAGARPYRLYALSNLGSMLGLLSYPALVEPNLAVRTQGRLWSAAYLLYALLCGAAAWRSAGVEGPKAVPWENSCPERPGWGLRVLWVALAGCASTLLLAVTAYLTQDVAAIPFLWILPLSVYLLSFILCFQAPPLYDRRVWLPLLAAGLGGLAHLLSPEAPEYGIPTTVAIAVGGLFTCSMVCHGEVVRSKPHPRYLTGFYLMIALGAALGGLFVGLGAPSLFGGYYELPLGLVGCGVLAAATVARERRAWTSQGKEWAAWLVVTAALASYGVWVARGVHASLQGARLVERNFYGQLRVKDADDGDGAGVRRRLLHGVITHGEQILSEDYRRRPLTYYCTASAVGRLLRATEKGPPRRIGVVGLGCGTLAAYGRPGDVIRFYEINPAVARIAQTEFHYLGDSAAQVEVILGDGRLMLEREAPQGFDALVMDAFSGDSVPVHLLTREAMGTYLRHLKPSGVLAVHISNKYLDLEPVVERAAQYYGKVALLQDYEQQDGDVECFGSTWVLVMDERTRSALAPAFAEAKPIPPRPDFRMWTDDFSSIFGILK